MLSCFSRVVLIHVTAGESENGSFEAHAGFENTEIYVAQRERELDEALLHLQLSDFTRNSYLHPDGAVVYRMEELIKHLEGALAKADTVFTHAFEGGHPDHDACSLAVQIACHRLGERGNSPDRWEFSGYHFYCGSQRRGQLWRMKGRKIHRILLGSERIERKKAAIAAFTSQKKVLAGFPVEYEEIRRAPIYNFTRPPPPGVFLYDWSGLDLKGLDWLLAVRRFMRPDKRLHTLPIKLEVILRKLIEKLLRPYRTISESSLRREAASESGG